MLLCLFPIASTQLMNSESNNLTDNEFSNFYGIFMQYVLILCIMTARISCK